MARRSKILGVPRLRRKLKRIDPEMRREVGQVIDGTAKNLLADLVANVPVSAEEPKGRPHLRDMLEARIARNELSARVGLLTRVAQRLGRHWRFLEHGTVKMPARPFVMPALLRAEASYAPRIRNAVDVALDRASRSEPIEAGNE